MHAHTHARARSRTQVQLHQRQQFAEAAALLDEAVLHDAKLVGVCVLSIVTVMRARSLLLANAAQHPARRSIPASECTRHASCCRVLHGASGSRSTHRPFLGLQCSQVREPRRGGTALACGRVALARGAVALARGGVALARGGVLAGT